MGRAPCCDKSNVKKGPWSPEEDANLKTYIEQHGTGGNWIALPHKIGLKRCGKSCRLRWLNYLRPNIKHGGFSDEEDNIICSLYMSIGSRWSIIAAQLPGRTDNDIKNYWNTRLKKKLLGKQRKQHARRGGNCPKEVTRKSTVENLSVSNTNINQAFPLWQGNIPVLPIPYSNHEPQFNDHASMRTLLIKLGGKFSDDDNKYQTGPDTQVPLMSSYGIPNSIEAIPPCSSMDALNVYESQISGFSMLPVDINIPTEFERVRYDHHHYTPQKLDGLEFLYNTASGNSVDWGEMSNLGYPSIMPNYEGTFQEECGLDNLKYAGVH